MKMWRGMQILAAAAASAWGTSAWAQANFVSLNRYMYLEAGCGSDYDSNNVSHEPGYYSDFLFTSGPYGNFRVDQTSNLTPDSMTGSIRLQLSECGGGDVRIEATFTLPEPQRWHLKWDRSTTNVPGLSHLIRTDGGFGLGDAHVDTVVELAAGEYAVQFSYTSNSFGEASTTFELTRMPPETSQQLTYQGELLESGVPYTGTADVQFTLFDAATGGTQVGEPRTVAGVAVNAGRFAASFNPPLDSFNAMSLYAQVGVRTNGGAFIPLAGRQPLCAAPFALRSATAMLADNATHATHATTADSATTADTATTATSATTATQANHALLADHATLADSVPFAGITSNPWTRTGSLLSTIQPVGIGKVPSDALDVLGNVRVNDQYIYLRGTGDNNHGLSWFGAGKPFATISPDGPVLFGYAGGLLGTRQGGDRVALAWNVLGQVGINTANTAGFTFAVNGTAAKTGGGSWATLSDPRTKTDIVPMTGTLDRLMQLHGYEFTYKPEFVASGFALPGRQIGLLATEVERVFPDWINRGNDGYMRVTERATTALMVEALRDLRSEKDQHLAELRERVSRLEALVKARREGK